MSLPYFSEFGWDATILAVDPSYVDGVIDPPLEKTVPNDVPVIRTKALPVSWTRFFGLGSLAFRALFYLWKAGNQLLARGDFDLVYFSTTMFPVMILGPIWKKRFGLPYVLDFQDLWLDDYYRKTRIAPPGGVIKYAFHRMIAKWSEPKIMRGVSQVLAVSPAYVHSLLARYSFLRSDQFTVVPFGTSQYDFDSLARLDIKQSIFDKGDGKLHWVYVGRAGKDIMNTSLRMLFAALREVRERNPSKWRGVRLYFVGTSYAHDKDCEKTVQKIAIECEVGDLVEEKTARVPYFEALQILCDSNAILVLGSDSPSYSASKVFPCIMARKPILAVVHEESPILDILRTCETGSVVAFRPARFDSDTVARTVSNLERLYEQSHAVGEPSVNQSEFDRYSAREITRTQCRVLTNANRY